MSERRVLVLTREHPPWDAADHVVFLGPWCLAKPHEGIPAGLPPAKSFSLLPFHWNNRTKLREDYDYLDGLHRRLLSSLAAALNRFHGADHSRRYWQILLDPWLMAYVGVMFDRWETIRLALADGGSFAVAEARDGGNRRDFSFNDFTTKILGDSGNGRIWTDILRVAYPDRATFFDAMHGDVTTCTIPAGSERKPALLKSVVARLASWFGPFLDRLTARSRFVFHQTMFDPLSLTRLSLALGQFPVFFYPTLQLEESASRKGDGEGASVRHLGLDFSSDSSFEAYLADRLPDDLPMCVVEHFQDLRSKAEKNRLQPEVILTAQSHWMNPLAKAWMADRVERGAELIILEHGGSLPARREFFDFEEDVADRKGTWFLPCHAKHVQVPPSKLLRHRKAEQRNHRSDGEYCLIVGGECPRYVYRAVFYPMANQGLRSFAMVNSLIERISPNVRKAIKIRPYQFDAGWNTGDLYAEIYGSQMISAASTLTRAFATARLIVSTYPETTFTEAMLTGKPVILIYEPDINERHPATFDLIVMLREAHIIFDDAAEAAAHLNRIWADPQKWWGSPNVTEARRAFKAQACRIEGDWLEEWKEFLLKTSDKDFVLTSNSHAPSK